MAKLGALLLKKFKSTKAKNSNFKEANTKKKNVQKLKNVEKNNAIVVQKTNSLKSSDLIEPSELLRKSIESFLLDQRSPHTRKAYGKDLKRFVQFLLLKKIRIGVSAIDRSLIIGYKDFLLTEKLEHTTIDRHLATLKSFFRWLLDDNIIEKNPAENVRFLNPKRESPTKGFTNDEVCKILAIPDLHQKSGCLHYSILMVLFFCGLRRSEVCDLRTSQLSTEREQYFFRLRGKGNAERIVLIIPQVLSAINYYLKMIKKDLTIDQPLFTPVKNNRTQTIHKPLDPSMIFYIVKKYSKLAGIANRVSPHSCRATAISNARDHHVPDRAIQEFAGWSTTTMITRYDKRKNAIEQSAAKSIDYGQEQVRVLPENKLKIF